MLRKLLVALLAIFLLKGFAFAGPTPQQELSGQDRTFQIQEQMEKLEQKIETEKKKPEIQEESPFEKITPPSTEKILIKDITVSGVNILSKKEVDDIISPFKNKELMLPDMQKVADLITDAYRQKGYITSRAYLPPQKIQEGLLEIKILEGMMGEIQVKGSRYFKPSLIENKITLVKGTPFNYNILRKNLTKINEHPDRYARAVITPGKEPGTTDLVLEMKEKLPMHIGFNFDNFGSRYIDKERFLVTASHNNLLGHDDILTFQYQAAQAHSYWLTRINYLFPVNNDLKVGFSGSHSKLDLLKEYKDLDARGKSRLYSAYANQSLIDDENLDLGLNLGFDYKDIFNFQQGIETSRDRLRVLRAGLDFDASDKFGRTIITEEIDFGIPDIMGGLKKQDSRASRSGAGGKFIKNSINLFRLQKMPFNSSLLWKNQLQLCPYILPAAEQFQIGGIANVRGYPPAEAVGDYGYATTFEWSFPVYFIPRKIKVPLSKAKLYDALKVSGFYDLGHTRLRRTQAGEEKNKTLRAAGIGLRFTLPEDLSLRLDVAWPLDNKPSDGKHAHTWVQFSKSF